MSEQNPDALRVRSNPDMPCPSEILRAITPLEIAHYGFDGSSQTGVIEVHEAVAVDVADFFALAAQYHFPVERVVRASDFNWDDDLLMIANASSGFNYRLIAGTNRVSQHGLGLAFDVNPLQNPYIRGERGVEIVAPAGAAWNPALPGTLSAEHPLVRFMLERGWEWGGNWPPASGRTDYQHFQKSIAVAGGVSEA
jgi:hypothetical protein